MNFNKTLFHIYTKAHTHTHTHTPSIRSHTYSHSRTYYVAFLADLNFLPAIRSNWMSNEGNCEKKIQSVNWSKYWHEIFVIYDHIKHARNEIRGGEHVNARAIRQSETEIHIFRSIAELIIRRNFTLTGQWKQSFSFSYEIKWFEIRNIIPIWHISYQKWYFVFFLGAKFTRRLFFSTFFF